MGYKDFLDDVDAEKAAATERRQRGKSIRALLILILFCSGIGGVYYQKVIAPQKQADELRSTQMQHAGIDEITRVNLERDLNLLNSTLRVDCALGKPECDPALKARLNELNHEAVAYYSELRSIIQEQYARP